MRPGGGGRTADEPDPETAPVVAWMFAQRLAGHSVARITRALNDAAIRCPSAADPDRNPHRSGAAWTLRTVDSILANPRYTGRQVWNRQRTDRELAGPASTGLGERPVQRWNLPAGWVISTRPAYPAIISEADYIAAHNISVPPGPAGPATRRYLLAGLLHCGRCGRRLESCWSNGKPAYRCRHGYTSATRPDPDRAKNLYVREELILPRLAARAILHAEDDRARRGRKQSSGQVTGPRQAADLIDRLRATGTTLIYDPATRALRTDTSYPAAITIG
jgi:site-specific DNA recombinase